MKTHDKLIQPEDRSNLTYWTKKWGVSMAQLNDAILNTGSLNPKRVRDYLRKDMWYQLPFFGLTRLFKGRTPSAG